MTCARREWVALHTPGHTEDHLCLFDPEGGVLLSGD
ncbi:MAG: MBL fold metallo-hydrolase, partial [Actinobacteria bacterium]|nr:MBL fold metallo-hydrolase [Actinomycetota bacterium]